MWEDKQLRNVTEADVRQLVNASVEEHLRLEYKQEPYSANMQGRKEMLLDICQFANTQGGLLLIGVPEATDGRPNPEATLGVPLANPEQILRDYDASVTARIEDRLPLESAAISIDGGTHVLVIRIPDSVNKPHCVNHEGHIYFPARRERHRYYMDVRELKEMVMRTASSLERAEEKLKSTLKSFSQPQDAPQLLLGTIPVFFKDFSLNIRNDEIMQTVRTFTEEQNNPTMTFTGLERIVHRDGSKVHIHRDGLVAENRKLALQNLNDNTRRFIALEAIDRFLHGFVIGASRVYQAARIGGPFLICMILRHHAPLIAALQDRFYPGGIVLTEQIGGGTYIFPLVQATDFTDIDALIRPLCDQAHQMFGRDGSRLFNANGVWTPRG